MSAIDVLRMLHSALEEGVSGDDLLAYFTPDVVTTEYPNRLKPDGNTLDLAAIIADSQRGTGLLRRQEYRILHSFEVGDSVAVRVTWTGEIGRDIGPFTDGQILTAHIAQFVDTRDGLVASIATYDCYEPF